MVLSINMRRIVNFFGKVMKLLSLGEEQRLRTECLGGAFERGGGKGW
jgi:hypothetical protein